MTTVRELYELWAGEKTALDTELERSLAPRGPASLYDDFEALGVTADQLILDAGARDAVHAIELVRRIGCRAVAIDPLPLHVERARRRVAEAQLEERIEIVEGALESLPFADQWFHSIWCRDMLNHVDLERGLAECCRVLRRGGTMLVYQTFATPDCEPAEAERLYASMATKPENMSPAFFEESARDAGLEIVRREQLSGEWRERWLEDGEWDVAADLLALSRLQRVEPALVERHGRAAVEAKRGGLVWGVYQLLGKTCPTIYVLERRA